jgi:type IV pilus assembly protein PilP
MTATKGIRFALLGLLVAAALSSGCGKKENKEQPPPPPAPKPKPAPPIQKPVSSTAVAPPALNFATKKDPFKPFVVAPKVHVPVKGAAPGGLPILAYDVTQFRLIGIVAGLKENRAMVVDPAGKPYVLKQGMHIGKYNGKITHITNLYVEVAEQYRDDAGKIRTNVVRLTLPRKS